MKSEASPVNQKCPVQVGPVLTFCHGDHYVKGEGGVSIWCVFVNCTVCVRALVYRVI